MSDLVTLVNTVNPTGILLTGGNSLEKYGGDAPERDRIDHQLIDIALYQNIPLYGFCRGMQSVLDYFGCSLESVAGHAAARERRQSGNYYMRR